MRAFPQWCCAPCLLLFLVIQPTSVMAADRASPKPEGDEKATVEFFEAMKLGTIEARIIPSDSRKANVWVENKTDKPVSVEMPLGFAGVPVAAQLGMPFADFGNNRQANQGVGIPGNAFPMVNFGGPAGGPGGGVGADPWGGHAIFNIPAGKTIKARVPCVCLDHGKPDPKPRVPYEIRPLDDVDASPELAELLAALGTGKVTQRVVQAAAWHITDDMTWEQLDAKRIRRITGQQQRWFHPSEIDAAKKLYAVLPSVKAGKKPANAKSDSMANRPASGPPITIVCGNEFR